MNRRVYRAPQTLCTDFPSVNRRWGPSVKYSLEGPEDQGVHTAYYDEEDSDDTNRKSAVSVATNESGKDENAIADKDDDDWEVEVECAGAHVRNESFIAQFRADIHASDDDGEYSEDELYDSDDDAKVLDNFHHSNSDVFSADDEPAADTDSEDEPEEDDAKYNGSELGEDDAIFSDSDG